MLKLSRGDGRRD